MRENFSIVLGFTNKFIYKRRLYRGLTPSRSTQILLKKMDMFGGENLEKLGQQKVDSIMTDIEI